MKCLSSAIIILVLLLPGCGLLTKKGKVHHFNYEIFKRSVVQNSQSPDDTDNVFDNAFFIPGQDSVTTLLLKIDTIWKNELKAIKNKGSLNAIDQNTQNDEAIINRNIKSLENYFKLKPKQKVKGCVQMGCPLLAEVVKSKQIMYLYMDGELKDSFAVSTGIKGRETPNIDQHPTGPVFIKYNSKKFPGGNYMGLGNMPYAVFVKGGYAIHGTTAGNFKKLGTRASHGCIRLHPDNAKIFNELVNMVGLNNTWVIVK